MRWLCAVMVLAGSAAFAQDEVYELPFAPDAGAPELPPLPPPLVEPPNALLPPASEPSRKPPGPPRWAAITGDVALLMTLHVSSGSLVAGAQLIAGKPFGAVTRTTTGSWPGDTFEGVLFAPGVELDYGRLGGALCPSGTTRLCGDRFDLGLVLLVAWAHGQADAQNVIRPSSMYYGQLSALADRGFIPSMPLAPGVEWWQPLARLRLGVRLPLGGAGPYAGSGRDVIPFQLDVALVGDYAPTALKGLSLGLALGLGF